MTKNEAISESNLMSLEEFVCSVCNSKFKTVTDVRWDMLKRNPSMNMEQLPSTYTALYQHILRAQYQCLVWEGATTAVPGVLEVSSYGWQLNGDHVMTTHLPAPDEASELLRCGCETGCGSGRCRCARQGTSFTELCLCENCDNEEWHMEDA